jgi:hypothetical protein
MSPFPKRFSKRRILFQRSIRGILWPRPSLYFPIGLLRNRGNVWGRRAQIYISGFPRSGNTFARDAFQSVNPGVKIDSHLHIPTFALNLCRRQIPGLVLIRKPLDAAISWSIYENLPIEETLAYWNDYHSVLMTVRAHLFVADFEAVTNDFGAVINSFNQFWRTSFVPFEHTAEAANECLKGLEQRHRDAAGNIMEARVSRPSAQRLQIKNDFLTKLERSDFLQSELEKAEKLYLRFLHYRKAGERRTSGRLIPEPVAKPGLGASIEA